jgi:hypothetical protein
MKTQETSHNKHPKRNLTRTLTRGLAGAALTVTAAMAPAVSTANAEKGPAEKKLSHYIPTRVLRKQADADLKEQIDLGAFNGALITNRGVPNGGTEATPTPSGGTTYPTASLTYTGKVFEHPIIMFRGNPKDQFGHNDYTNGDYAFFKLVRGKHPHVEPIKFNPATDVVEPWTMEGSDGPEVRPFIFQSDKAGHLNLSEPLTSPDWQSRLHGTPLTDSMGQTWKIGLEIPSPKG